MSTEETSATFVAELEKSEVFPLGGELLITIWNGTVCRVAWREYPWKTWSAPIAAEHRE